LSKNGLKNLLASLYDYFIFSTVILGIFTEMADMYIVVMGAIRFATYR